MTTSPLTPDESEADRTLVATYGSVPNLFQVQGLVPRAVDAEAKLLMAVELTEGELTRRQKRRVLEDIAGASQNEYCRTLYPRTSAAGDDEHDALLAFSLKLARQAPWFSGKDVETLAKSGFDDVSILEAIATTALGQMLCTLAAGLQPKPDSESAQPVLTEIGALPEPPEDWFQTPGPYLGSPPPAPVDFPPFVYLREQLGFVPNLFRAQMFLPDLVQAEVHALDCILFTEDVLSRIQKERILLVVSAANLNTYSVAVHRQTLSALGVPLEDCDQIADNHQAAPLSEADKALLAEVRKLSQPLGRTQGRFDREALRRHGFTEPQIIEAVAVSGLTNFLNTLQFGLGTVPDFPPRRVFTPKDLYPASPEIRPTFKAVPAVDPDSALVARVQGGDVDGFEELVRRHSSRVYSTLAGIVGNPDDARDAAQDVFLKAFEKLGQFEGRSKFSTWLLSIAIHEGTEILRQRRALEPLEDSDDDDDFRPRQVQSWADDPEQRFSAAERDELVRRGILRLPERYRVALILRDINQLTTEEAAAALDLSVPALKARVLRGRLMLRESLAQHFIQRNQERDDA